MQLDQPKDLNLVILWQRNVVILQKNGSALLFATMHEWLSIFWHNWKVGVHFGEDNKTYVRLATRTPSKEEGIFVCAFSCAYCKLQVRQQWSIFITFAYCLLWSNADTWLVSQTRRVVHRN